MSRETATGTGPATAERDRGSAELEGTGSPRRIGEAGMLRRTGRLGLAVAADTGGMAIIAARSLMALVPPRVEVRGLVRSMYRFGVESIPLVMATAFLTGVVVLLLAAVYVRSYGATQLVGWATGYATFRELGPMLIALMFSGRVGSNNTAELATMKVTDQIEALRSLAIDFYSYLVIPRLFAMVVVLAALTLIGNLLAILGGAVAGELILGVSYAVFWNSFVEGVKLVDLTHGLLKAGAFGLAVGIVSCHCGLSAKGGAPGVGHAVNKSVVSSALAIFILDFTITYFVP